MADTTTTEGGATASDRGHRRTIEGIVKSAKMDKTITVEIHWLQKHPKYGKFMKRYTKFYAHDEKREAKEGDVVQIVETRPLSKLKRYRLLKVVRKAAQV
jgi:small subunit ribosomal protein S17